MSRLCVVCNKPFSHPNPNTVGCSPECRRIRKYDRTRRWYALNPGKANAKHRRWVATNADRAREQNRQWRLRFPEAASERNRRWRAIYRGAKLLGLSPIIYAATKLASTMQEPCND